MLQSTATPSVLSEAVLMECAGVGRVSVLGAGPAGLLAAAALAAAAKTARVEVYEAKNCITRKEDYSIPVVIGERAVRFFTFFPLLLHFFDK